MPCFCSVSSPKGEQHEPQGFLEDDGLLHRRTGGRGAGVWARGAVGARPGGDDGVPRQGARVSSDEDRGRAARRRGRDGVRRGRPRAG